MLFSKRTVLFYVQKKPTENSDCDIKKTLKMERQVCGNVYRQSDCQFLIIEDFCSLRLCAVPMCVCVCVSEQTAGT